MDQSSDPTKNSEIPLKELTAETVEAFDRLMQDTMSTWRERHEEEINRANARNAALWKR